MDKKLINFDEVKFNRQEYVFIKNRATLNEIADEYNQLGIGKISQKRIREIISGRFGDIETALDDAVEKEAKNSLVRDVLKTEILERFENFQTKVEHLVIRFEKNQHTASEIIPTPIEYFTINKEGRFDITDETWEKIKDERCSNFIFTERAQKIHDALQTLSSASNDFLSALGPEVKQRHFPPNAPWDMLTFTDKGYEPDPETDYEYLAQ